MNYKNYFLKLKTLFSRPIFWVVFASAILVVLPFLWIPEGYIINSEDQGFMNYEVLLSTSTHSWIDRFSHGEVAGPPNHSLIMPLAFFYSILKFVGLGNPLIQKLFIGMCILLSIASFYFFSTIFTRRKELFLISFLGYFLNFYVANSFNYPAKIFQIILAPFLFFLTYKLLETRDRRYIAFHFFVIFFFQAVFTNIPQFIALCFSYMFAVFFFSIKTKTRPKSNLFILIPFFLVIIPVIFYQGLVWIFSVFYSISDITTSSTFTSFYSRFSQIFQFRGAWWEYGGVGDAAYNHWKYFYDNWIILIASFVIFIFTFSLFTLGSMRVKRVGRERNFLLIFFIFSLAITSGLSFSMGVYELIYDKIPFFSMFREPWSKFMPLTILSFSALVIYALKNISNKKYFNFIYVLLFFAIILRGAPFFSRNFYEANKKYKQTFIKPTDYWWEYSAWTKKIADKNILAIPYVENSLDYEYRWYGENKIGNTNSNMSFVLGYANVFSPSLVYGPGIITDIFSKKNSFDFIKLGRLNYVMFQDDLTIINNQEKYLWQNEEIKKYIQDKPVEVFGNKLFVYKIKEEFSLPHFFISQNPIVSGRSVEDLPKILFKNNWQPRSAIFLRGQNVGKENKLEKLKNNNRSSNESDNDSNDATLGSRLRGNDINGCADEGVVMMPTLEFKKINPTKYRVRVHSASGVFPLVFSESFHDGWKAYLATPNQETRSKKQDTNLNSYKILDGNSEDQATMAELQDYIDNGFVTTLGDMREKSVEHKKWVDPVKASADDRGAGGKEVLDYIEKYNIDFVSKNFQGTIQNDNLPAGNIFETWFRRPIENNANHLTANGYANAWVIDTNLICQSNSKLKNQISNIKMGDQGLSGSCIQNPDGSYDFELVVEFWPQRLFYVGLFISGMTLLACVGYLGYDWRKRRKPKESDKQ